MLARMVLLLGSAAGWSLPAVAAAQPDEAYADEPVPALSLDDFLRRVQANNPVLDVARAELNGYKATFDRAYYAWTPTIKIESLLAPLPERRLLRECVIGVHDPSGAPLIGPCPGERPATDDTLTPDTEIGILTRTTAKITFPIYTFGKIEAAQRASRAGVDVGRAGIDATRGELILLVKRAYYGAQLADNALSILKDGRKRLRKAKKDIEKELDKESGRFTRNDLRKLLVKEADLESSYLETDALAQVAWEGLRIAGRFRPGEPFQLDSLKLRSVHVEPRATEAYVELASISRPDLRMSEAAVRAREAQVEMAVADFYPDIALVGAVGYAKGTTAEESPDPFANDQYNFLRWGAVLGAEWKIDLADRLGKLREAEARVSKQRAQHEALRMKVRLDVVERVGRLTRFRGELDVRRLAMKAGKGWLVSNSLNFGLGLATTDDLLDSLIAYSTARLKYFQTIYEYNLAVAKLSQTVGVELAVPAEALTPASTGESDEPDDSGGDE